MISVNDGGSGEKVMESSFPVTSPIDLVYLQEGKQPDAVKRFAGELWSHSPASLSWVLKMRRSRLQVFSRHG